MKFIASPALILIFVLCACKVSPQVTFLDNFQPLLRYSWAKSQSLVQHRTFDYGVELNIRHQKTQPQFSPNYPFFCDTRFGRSFNVPTTVHKLRPGDIDIVGAIGDSLTTGASAFSLNPLQIILDGKGVSWSIGGQYSWRQFLTIPNILKEFNPKIYGFSLTGQGNSFRNSSKFNVAEVLVSFGELFRAILLKKLN